ncbi:DoxX family protein [Actinosynnema mirum]|uniref:DoxX family protein n=1 Tax=Actinosynnema mirum (strain ATCC 29888 / DSM 43827 / JCM 3225 / NBRC 14064 / NCIMB 13271 / NRRL B-12336 / IMRU 3971 / 101) TaxID=446462 RepID=C6WG68_ACTMD|nr:DoxX family protein [Actinosynnema mirum]ACU39832.1 DoxX family protein [Actinosynnema mirum DSM 43827]
MANQGDRRGSSGGYTDDGLRASGATARGAHHYADEPDPEPAQGRGTKPLVTGGTGTGYFDGDDLPRNRYGRENRHEPEDRYEPEDDVQPHRPGTGTGFTPVPDLDEPVSRFDDAVDRRLPPAWTASHDVGLLALRLGLGLVFTGHGLQKVFGLFDGPGLDAFGKVLASIGYQQSGLLAWVTGLTELVGGVLLILGFATPLAAAGVLGVMANVLLLNYTNGFFLPDGVEFEAALAAAALGVLFAGPGRVSLDHRRPWFHRPLLAASLCLLLATGLTALTHLVLR